MGAMSRMWNHKASTVKATLRSRSNATPMTNLLKIFWDYQLMALMSPKMLFWIGQRLVQVVSMVKLPFWRLNQLGMNLHGVLQLMTSLKIQKLWMIPIIAKQVNSVKLTSRHQGVVVLPQTMLIWTGRDGIQIRYWKVIITDQNIEIDLIRWNSSIEIHLWGKSGS